MSNIVKLPFVDLLKSPFRRGRKEVYLPAFTITLLRTPHQPATSASFLVPLQINKLDLRDYLFHAYNIRTFSVRSFTKYSRVTQGKPSAKQPVPQQWYRPKPTKKMTVEMDRPFVWPEEISDLEPWSKKTFDLAQDEQRNYVQSIDTLKDTRIDEDHRVAMREQARDLLKRAEQRREQSKSRRNGGRIPLPDASPNQSALRI